MSVKGGSGERPSSPSSSPESAAARRSPPPPPQLLPQSSSPSLNCILPPFEAANKPTKTPLEVEIADLISRSSRRSLINILSSIRTDLSIESQINRDSLFVALRRELCQRLTVVNADPARRASLGHALKLSEHAMKQERERAGPPGMSWHQIAHLSRPELPWGSEAPWRNPIRQGTEEARLIILLCNIWRLALCRRYFEWPVHYRILITRVREEVALNL